MGRERKNWKRRGGGRGEQKIGMERGYWERRGDENIGERRKGKEDEDRSEEEKERKSIV